VHVKHVHLLAAWLITRLDKVGTGCIRVALDDLGGIQALATEFRPNYLFEKKNLKRRYILPNSITLINIVVS